MGEAEKGCLGLLGGELMGCLPAKRAPGSFPPLAGPSSPAASLRLASSQEELVRSIFVDHHIDCINKQGQISQQMASLVFDQDCGH